jgi:hypothetical protein
MEDQDYIKRRDHLLKIMVKQNVLADKGLGDDLPNKNHAKRGRKPTKPNKFVEKEKNTKLYAPKKYKKKFG